MNSNSVFNASLIGQRRENEDALTLYNCKKKHTLILGVYDGHGGDFTSKFLSQYMHLCLQRILDKLNKSTIVELFNNIQTYLTQTYKKEATKSGSTAVIAIYDYKDNHLTVINVGDSRCILSRNNLALVITKDHKPNWPEEKYRIEGLNGKIYLDKDTGDWRIGKLSVSRAFGDLDSIPYVTHLPNIYRYKVSKEDQFMVLACDGLWDVLSNQDVVNYIILNCYKYNKEQNIVVYNANPNIANDLAKYAISKGSTDNISIIIYFFNITDVN
jgi:serine/threonine protein phosphatase PrpC